jgi:hypothetical protein
MANSVTTNPITIDTAGVINAGALTIRAIHVSFTAAAQTVLLSDADGNIVYRAISTAESLTDGITVPGGIKVPSLTATTVTAGAVCILYLR